MSNTLITIVEDCCMNANGFNEYAKQLSTYVAQNEKYIDLTNLLSKEIKPIVDTIKKVIKRKNDTP